MARMAQSPCRSSAPTKFNNYETVTVHCVRWKGQDPSMKNMMTNTGWTETTTKIITVTALGKKAILSVEHWVDFNRRYPKIGRKRKTCKRCRRKWTELAGDVNIVFTDKGNKAVCDDCMKELRAQFEKVVDAEM